MALALAGALLVPQPSQAATITFSDVFDPADVFMTNQVAGGVGAVCVGTNSTVDTTTASSSCGSLSWTHALVGYNPLTDTLNSAQLTLTLYDDTDSPAETYSIALDLLTDTGHTITSGSTASTPFTFSYNVHGQLVLDGLLNALLTNPGTGNHDFWFARAVLDASWDTGGGGTPVVPEPTSIALLGGGLLAVAARMRRRRRA
jgi:hypothetical protein